MNYYSFIFSLFVAIASHNLFSMQKIDGAEGLFLQRPDGTYVPHQETMINPYGSSKINLLRENDHNNSINKQKVSILQRLRDWFATPFDINLPLLGNTKNIFYQLKYRVEAMAKDFYDDVFQGSEYISKEYIVAVADAYLFHYVTSFLTPVGGSNQIMSKVVLKNFIQYCDYVRCPHSARYLATIGIYGLYNFLTKNFDIKLYFLACGYDFTLRSTVTQFVSRNGFFELILLSCLAPSIIPYLS